MGLTIIGIVIVLALDAAAKTGLVKRKMFWIFHLIVLGVTTLVDNFISGGAVRFPPEMILGIKVGSTPVENYLFGFSLLTLNLVLFEKWRKIK